MSKTQIARLDEARRRNLVRAERALAAGDISTAEILQARAEDLRAKGAAARKLAREAAADERAAQLDAIAMSESLTVKNLSV